MVKNIDWKRLLLIFCLFVAGMSIYCIDIDHAPMLATGDHGRDLYSPQALLKGVWPIHDYSWVYGPLMPIYYAGILKILGVSIQNVLIGQILLKILAGIFIFFILRLSLPIVWSFIGTLWFWIFFPFFFHTF